MTSIEWAPFESSVLATASADGQLAVWDLALERDPEEEAALAAHMNAASPEDLPPQLLFVHLGQARAPSCFLSMLYGMLSREQLLCLVTRRLLCYSQRSVLAGLSDCGGPHRPVLLVAGGDQGGALAPADTGHAHEHGLGGLQHLQAVQRALSFKRQRFPCSACD